MKSLLTSVFWPAWEWTIRPYTRTVFGSYAMALAIRDSVKCRTLLDSSWYREHFQPAWSLKGDQNLKSYFENTATGIRQCVSVGSGATGFRGDKVVVDDPLNAMDALSEAKRVEATAWWDTAMSSRLNDQRTGARVVIMQRLHHLDLAGHILERGGYDHLNLPSEFESDKRATTSIGWSDPRQEEGEPLFPAKFPREVLAEAKQDLGPDHYAAQHQQRPTPREGSFFQRSWFEIVDAAPVQAKRMRGWDRAATEGAGDWTAGVRIARDSSGTYYIEHVRRFRHGPGERDRLIRQTAEIDGRETAVRGEQEPGSAGVDQSQAFIRLLAGFRVDTKPATGAKEVRADPMASQAKAGNVKIVRGDWNEAFLEELSQFPLGAHDDQVDAASIAFNGLAMKRSAGAF